jgi:hypothetical protein
MFRLELRRVNTLMTIRQGAPCNVPLEGVLFRGNGESCGDDNGDRTNHNPLMHHWVPKRVRNYNAVLDVVRLARRHRPLQRGY